MKSLPKQGRTYNHEGVLSMKKESQEEIRKPSSMINAKKLRKTIKWERLEGTGNPLQYSCLENPMDGGAW